MKFQKSSRIIAIALAVVMILPLISVMAFADGEGEATSNVIYSADFESYELVDGKFSWTAADATWAGNPNGEALAYKQTNNLPADLPAKCTGNDVVVDPKAPADAEDKNQVYSQVVKYNNNNNSLRLETPEISYETTPNLVFSYDILIPADAMGTYQFQSWVKASTKGEVKWCYTHFIDFSTEQAFLKLDNNQMGVISSSTKNSVKIARDTWTTVTWALDLVSGDFTWYLNGNVAAVGNFDKGNVVFTEDRWHFAKAANGGADYDNKAGTVYFDNISIVKGEYEAETLWKTDYSAYEVGAAAAQDNTNFAKNPNDGKTTAMHTIVADPVVDGNKVLAVNNYGGFVDEAVDKKNPTPETKPVSNWDNNNGKYAVPAISYETVKAVTFGFDIYVPKTTRGQIHWQWGATGTDANGAVVTTNKAWNDIIYIYQVPEEEFATIGLPGKQNIDDKDDAVLKLAKEKWVRVEYSVDLVTGESNLTIDGKQAWRGYFTVNGIAVTNINIEANALIYAKLLKDAHCKDGTNTGLTYFKNESVTVGKNVRNDIVVKYPEGTMYIQDFQGFTADQAIDKGTDAGFIADSKVVEAHKAVVDPKNAENIVWYRPLDDKQGANDDPWAKLANDRAAFAENPVVDLTTDYYLPADATGYFQVQLYGSASGTNNYFHLWDINVTDSKIVEHYDGTAPFTAVNETEGVATLPRDTWFTVRTIIDLVTGKYDVFVGTTWIASGHIRGGDKNIIISANNLDVSCLRCSQGAAASYTGMATYVQSGYVLIDNIELKKFNGSVVKVTATGLADGVIGTKVGDTLLEAGVHVFDEAVEAVAVNFDKTPFANLFKSTIGEFRLCEDEGIRFVTEIDATVLAALLADTNTSDALVKKGTIILPANYVTEGLEITFEGLAAAGIDYLDVTYDDLTAEYAENKIAGSIYNIKNTNMNREFIAVPYVQVTLPHGNTLTIYGAASEGVTVAELAAAALANTTATYNGVEKALLEEYAAKVKAD